MKREPFGEFAEHANAIDGADAKKATRSVLKYECGSSPESRWPETFDPNIDQVVTAKADAAFAA